MCKNKNRLRTFVTPVVSAKFLLMLVLLSVDLLTVINPELHDDCWNWILHSANRVLEALHLPQFEHKPMDTTKEHFQMRRGQPRWPLFCFEPSGYHILFALRCALFSLFPLLCCLLSIHISSCPAAHERIYSYVSSLPTHADAWKSCAIPILVAAIPSCLNATTCKSDEIYSYIIYNYQVYVVKGPLKSSLQASRQFL